MFTGGIWGESAKNVCLEWFLDTLTIALSKKIIFVHCLPDLYITRTYKICLKCQISIKISICWPCSEFKASVRMTSTQMSVPETTSDSLWRNSWVAKPHQLAGQSVPDIHAGEEADIKVASWRGYMLSAVGRPAGYTAKVSVAEDSLDIESVI